MIKKISNQNGQALVLVIVSLTVALALVASISLRNLSSVSRVSQTDSFSRVSATAEAGIERFLIMSQSTLTGLVNTPTNCPTNTTADTNSPVNPAGRPACVLNIPGNTGDNISTRAYVWVTASPAANSPLDIEMSKDETFELSLSSNGTSSNYTGNSINLCWKPKNSSTGVVFYVSGYTSTVQDKYLVSCASGCAWYSLTNNGVVRYTATSAVGNSTACAGDTTYTDFYTITGTNNNYLGLRVRAIGGDAYVKFVPSAGASLPQQGFVLNSLGVLINNASIAATKKTTVFKSFSYPAGIFDFGIYTPNPL